MSKERELIKDMKILLECTDMGSLQRNADVLISRAIELLAQPEQLKRSALTEAEISKTLKISRRSTEWDYGFEAGVVFAEEFHGIGEN